MSRLTLTTRNGEVQELSLPLGAEEFLKRPMPYYMVYVRASATFETPDAELNEALAGCLPETVEGGVKELSLLAYILGKTDDEGLTRIKESLPERAGSVEDILKGVYSPYDLHRLADRHTRTIQQDIEKQRMTGGELFKRVMARATENGDLVHFDAIGDYSLADDMENGKLCSYEFDLLPAVNFGGSEGIYIDCSLRGKFDESGRKALHIGTLKTLDTGLEACKTMGELCGVLLYHENQYVNENLCFFDSTEAIDRMLSKPLRMEQAPTMEMTMGGQQM